MSAFLWGLAGSAVIASAFACPAGAGSTRRISISSHGEQTNAPSGDLGVAVSGNGRYVAFSSGASNIVPDDFNGAWDVFVHDRETGRTDRVSISSAGTEGDHEGGLGISVSHDGRFVAFVSRATNLAPNDHNALDDVFVRDRALAVTTRVSVATSGAEAEGESRWPSISADGRYVAFISSAANLVPDDTNQHADAFVHDRLTGQTARVSVTLGGLQANGSCLNTWISDDGRFVLFLSDATNLIPPKFWIVQRILYVHDRATGQIEFAGVSTTGEPVPVNSASISGDGRFVAFGSDSFGVVPGVGGGALYIRDRLLGVTDVVSVSTGGALANNYCILPTISADGRHVVFTSRASNLVPGPQSNRWDVFVRDTHLATTARLSVSTGGALSNGHSGIGAFLGVSAGGRVVAFGSQATNLVQGDTNDWKDVFAHDRAPTCPSDANHDDLVDFVDLNIVLAAFGSCAGMMSFLPNADLDGDGCATFEDLNIVLSAYGTVCTPWSP